MIAKRILSIFLVLILLVGMLPSQTFGTENWIDTTTTSEEQSSSGPTGDSDLDSDMMTALNSEDVDSRQVRTSNCLQMDFRCRNGVRQGFHYTYDSDPSCDRMNLIYCIDDTKKFPVGFDISVDTNQTVTGDMTGATSYGQISWYSLSAEKRMAIALVLLYGCPNELWDEEWGINAEGDWNLHNPNIGYRFATQALVWEFAGGYRDANYPFEIKNTYWYDNGVGMCMSEDGETDHFLVGYNHILNSMLNHDKIPSFTGIISALAPEHYITPGTPLTLTDTNGVLDRFEFSDTEGVSYVKRGNQLTINTNGTVPSGALSAVKQMPVPEASIVELVYARYDSSLQTCVKLSIPVYDPVPAYYKLKLTTGSILIKKTTNTGSNLEGWTITLFSDSACTKKVGSYVTGMDGTITAGNLTPGIYYAKETGAPGDSSMWTMDTSVKTVKVEAGETASVEFNNVLNGRVKIVKKTNTGDHLEGWEITLYSDKECTKKIGTYVTGKDGTITSGNLVPGTYYAKETGAPGDSSMWTMDTSVKTVKVEAGETVSVEFNNVLNGRVKIVKKTNTGKNLEGWEITLYSDKDCTKKVGSYVTGKDGTIITGNFTPGTYYAKETGASNKYPGWWTMDTSVKTVKVEAGKTASVEFNNILNGRAIITKKTNTGDNLEGWIFGIYRDEDCTDQVASLTSGANGKTDHVYLDPGTYYWKEIGDNNDRFNSEFWPDETTVQSITIAAGEETAVEWTNNHYGKIQLNKKLDTDGNLDGWKFKVTDSTGKEVDGSPFVTVENGRFTTGLLEPGTYTVEEIIPDDSLFYCKSENPQTVTVRAGETASVSFTNALRPGKIAISKVNYLGQKLAGAKFLLEWSDDNGKTWNPVTYSDKEDVIKGGCTTEGLADGCLVTDASGYIVFEDLYPGLKYRVTELEAPDGYVMLTDYAYVGDLPAKDLTVDLTVYNSQGYVLPSTGVSDKTFTLITIGAFTAITTLFLGLLLVAEHRVSGNFVVNIKKNNKGKDLRNNEN